MAAKDAGALAVLILSAFEGAIVLARAARDAEPLDLVQAQLRSLISSQTTTTARKKGSR